MQLKIYYRFLELIALSPIKENNVESSFKKCFIYYDYEREFSGHKINLSDGDIEHLLNHLDEINLKTTWFTVGKVIEKYPETIFKIKERGHEIGSHTFTHTSPKVMKKINLETDFVNFEKICSTEKLSVEGFHSPNGQWNTKMFNFLVKNKFIYDVISLPLTGKKITPMKFQIFKTYPLVRLVTIGDDWPLFGANKSRREVFEYFKSLYLIPKIGDIFGIGFHPWILYSDKSILMGYKDFLSYLNQQENTVIKPAGYFVNNLKLS
ncbi:polysaccharide deacetylase family protein [Salegentibacter salegens]|nr:polysaccharide deacetylase family protein [Salegentibacter salegens]